MAPDPSVSKRLKASRISSISSSVSLAQLASLPGAFEVTACFLRRARGVATLHLKFKLFHKNFEKSRSLISSSN